MAATALYEKKPLLHSDNEKNRITYETEKVTCHQVPARHVLAIMGFLGFFILLSLRASFSVAVVAMVNSTSSSEGDSGGAYNGSSNADEAESRAAEPQGEFNWDETTQGLILGAYYYGYPWPQLLGGQLAEKTGGRNVLGMGVLLSAILNFLIPVAARTGVGLFIAARVLQGVAESVTFPSMHAMWGVWAPVQERSRLANLTYTGVEVGTVLGMLTAGLLSQYGFAGGWPSIFYLHGILGCVWVLAWMLLIHDTPSKHPRITAKERELIAHPADSKKTLKTPWFHILTSPAVWAITANHFTTAWGFGSMVSMLPTYLSNMLHFDIEQTGILSSVPFVAQWLMEAVGSVLLDVMKSRLGMTTQFSRKLLNSIGAVVAAAFIVAATYVPEESPILAVALLTLGMGASAFCVCCLRVSHLDIAPRFAGTLYGLTNTFANISGFLSPLVAGVLTENQQTMEQWRIYFSIIAAMFVAGALVFNVFGKGEELWWAKGNPHRQLGSGDNDEENGDK